VRGTLAAILDGIRDQEDLFSNAALEQLFTTSLDAVARNSRLFTNAALLQAVIKNTVGELTRVGARKLFSGASVEAITRGAVLTVAENSEVLIDPADPQRQVIAHAVAAIAHGLASDLAGPGSVKDLFSTTELVHRTQTIFREVATHPAQLLGADGDAPRRTALAQILASVATALGDDPTKLVNGHTLVELLETAVQVTLKNVDKLLDRKSEDPKTNPLFKVLAAVVDGIQRAGDVRHLADREVFLDLARRVLPVVSANMAPLPGGDEQAIAGVVAVALQLAQGPLDIRINGATLPKLVEGLLRSVLSKDVSLTDAQAIAAAADSLLRLAA
jgi:hypothetical protein